MGFSFFSPLTKPFKNLISSHIEEDESSRPSPSNVLLPDYLTTKSVNKDHLPVVERATFISHNNEKEGDDDCAICLKRIEAWHNVRQLNKCEHAFHVECLDSWIDRGGDTCPVCRAWLVSGEVGHGKDPWRSERMVYLFGEDCLMEELQ
ncbi:E3 ubiquitin-protein ligase RHA1B-like [Salvia hispanica]|uniref:E3 ubiquitin-protein ligase RHA1B-like n=1 Tax=Salvia hispanica TaxID=49212 RepID=UPI0020090C2B|nr:E3 ubiquitin-protein ligase RHA1B-like [Salvia hispanica]